jgi:hypothetical protein
VSLPTRLASGTLIDNIFTNNLEDKIEAGLVTVEVSDHLPIFAMVGGSGGRGQDEELRCNQRRKVTEERMADFTLVLESWDWRVLGVMGVEDNVARFRNKFRDIYNEVFPLTEDKRKRKEKPWLDDPRFKAMVGEKGELFSRKVKGREQEGDRERLAEVTREVNRNRRQLRKAYFSQRLEGVMGDARSTGWW